VWVDCGGSGLITWRPPHRVLPVRFQVGMRGIRHSVQGWDWPGAMALASPTATTGE